VRSAPEEVTILALGPLTNIARALKRDSQLASAIGHIIMMCGSVDGIGNVTPAAEFNCFYDPDSARTVFQSPTTKTLVPLDISRQVVFSLDFMDRLPSEETRAGLVLRGMLPHLYRAYRQRLGMELVHIHDAIAMIMALHPELFETTKMAADVEVRGELTRGATIFDRRMHPQWRPNMEVAIGVDAPAVLDAILRGLTSAGEQTKII
jgi:purine nucleosidase